MFRNINFFLPTFGQCWVIVLLIIVAGGLFSIPFHLSTKNPLILYTVTFLPALLYLLLKGREAGNGEGAVEFPLERYGKDSFLRAFAIVFMLALSTVLLSIILDPLFSLVEIPDSLVEALYKPMVEKPFWNIITVTMAAPLIEEFFVRGVIMRGMLHHLSPAKAIIWSAFIFALIHFNLYQAIGAFSFGIFLGWVYYKSGSLLYCIVVHSINNTLAAAMLFILPEQDVTLYDIVVEHSGLFSYLMLYLISALLFGLIIYVMNKILVNGKQKETLPS